MFPAEPAGPAIGGRPSRSGSRPGVRATVPHPAVRSGGARSQRVAARRGRAARPAVGVAAQGRRRHPGHRGEVLGQRGDRHRQPGHPGGHQPRAGRLRPVAEPQLRLGLRQRAVRPGLEDGAAGHHPQDRQGTARGTSTTRTPTRSSWPAPRTWSRSGPSGTAAGSEAPSPAGRGRPRLPGPGLPAPGRGPVRADRALARPGYRRDATGARSPAPTSPRSTARPQPAASPTPATRRGCSAG